MGNLLNYMMDNKVPNYTKIVFKVKIIENNIFHASFFTLVQEWVGKPS